MSASNKRILFLAMMVSCNVYKVTANSRFQLACDISLLYRVYFNAVYSNVYF